MGNLRAMPNLRVFATAGGAPASGPAPPGHVRRHTRVATKSRYGVNASFTAPGVRP